MNSLNDKSVAEKVKMLEDQKQKVTDQKIKEAIDAKIKALNTPINK